MELHVCKPRATKGQRTLLLPGDLPGPHVTVSVWPPDREAAHALLPADCALYGGPRNPTRHRGCIPQGKPRVCRPRPSQRAGCIHGR